jgi:protein-S-isoprenylcysteine O-methyltransferase Ste14
VPGSEASDRAPWWKGARGEWYVVVQVALFILVAFGPRTHPGLPAWPGTLVGMATIMGIALMASGGALMCAAFLGLGKNLTPLPFPKGDGHLVQTGAYGLVRHPIYCGGVALAFGWALCVHGPLTLGYACLLFIFVDVKSRREERWLAGKFPGYAEYQKRVRRLLPFLY